MSALGEGWRWASWVEKKGSKSSVRFSRSLLLESRKISPCPGLRVSRVGPAANALTAFSKWPTQFLPPPTPKLIPALGPGEKDLPRSGLTTNLALPPSSPSLTPKTTKMAPPKRTTKPAQENISLGPQVREGKSALPRFAVSRLFANQLLTRLQASSCSALPASSPRSTTPSSTSPISRTYTHEITQRWNGAAKRIGKRMV